MNKTLLSKLSLGLIVAGATTAVSVQQGAPMKLDNKMEVSPEKIILESNLKKPVIKIDEELSSELAELENLDFTPNEGDAKSIKIDSAKIEFQNISKKIDLKETEITKAEFPVSESIASSNLNLSFDEIEEQSRFEVTTKVKIEYAAFKINDFSYEVKNIAKKLEKKNEDRISTTIASISKDETETSTLNKLDNNPQDIQENVEADELVFFDYSENKDEGNVSNAVNTQIVSIMKSPENGISNTGSITKTSTVHSSAQTDPKSKKNRRLKGTAKKAKKRSIDPNLIAMLDTNDKNKFDLVSQKDSGIRKAVAELLKQDEIDYSCLDEKSFINEYSSSKLNIQLQSINNSKSNLKNIHNFQMKLAFDQDEILQDAGSGKIEYSLKTNDGHNITRARFLATGHIPTVTDISLNGVEESVTIPSMSIDKMEAIINEFNLGSMGAALLVKLDARAEDVELDQKTKYTAKFFLNNKLKIVNRGDSDYNYILFIGAEAGNTILYYKTIDNQITDKIVNLSYDEMYFEDNYFMDIEDDFFKIYQENLLSRCKSLYSLSSENIVPWSFEGKVANKALNEVAINNMVYPAGTRKYYELKTKNESIYIGRFLRENIIIPSEDYMRNAISKFNTIGNECMVQINLTKQVSKLAYDSETGSEIMNSQIKFLDANDGKFYTDISADTSRVFILGEQEGIFNIKIDFIDGTSQLLQSYCSENSYIIEQI